MGNLGKFSLAVAGLCLSASAALAADIIEPPYSPPEVIPPAIGGWYLRGDIGMSNQKLHGDMYNVLYDSTDIVEHINPGSFDSAPTFQIGVGYQFSDWLRADVTAQYRGAASFSGLDRYETTDDSNPLTFDGTDEYTAKKTELLFMANAYWDMGTWSGITPYVGAGIGAAKVTISDFMDVNTPTAGVAYGGTHSEWNLAWALHAGLGFQISDRLTMDLGYSYLHLGDGRSGDLVPFAGANTIDNPMILNDIVSHDFKFGLRYAFN